MHPVIKYCLVVAIGLSASAALAETQGTKASRADEMFIKEAMQGDLAEVSMGKLAQEKAQSEGVKDFGKMLEEDHGKHSQKVQGKAQELGVSPPQEPSTTQKSMYDRLSKLSGAQFDQQFVKAMVTDHKEDIATRKKRSRRVRSPISQRTRCRPCSITCRLRKHWPSKKVISVKARQVGLQERFACAGRGAPAAGSWYIQTE